MGLQVTCFRFLKIEAKVNYYNNEQAAEKRREWNAKLRQLPSLTKSLPSFDNRTFAWGATPPVQDPSNYAGNFTSAGRIKVSLLAELIVLQRKALLPASSTRQFAGCLIGKTSW